MDGLMGVPGRIGVNGTDGLPGFPGQKGGKVCVVSLLSGSARSFSPITSCRSVLFFCHCLFFRVILVYPVDLALEVSTESRDWVSQRAFNEVNF